MYVTNHLPRKIGHIVPPTLKRFQNEPKQSKGSEVSVGKREKKKKLPCKMSTGARAAAGRENDTEANFAGDASKMSYHE